MPIDDKDRMTNLGELAAVLAHEMKNPMNSIIINLETLRNTISDLTGGAESLNSTKAKKYLDVIEGEVKRLDKVLRGFLDFANPPQSTKVRFKINPIIKLMADFMGQEFKQKGISVDLDLEQDLPAIHGSADQFKQALLNLMINALQATPASGKVKISTLKKDQVVRLTISDTGSGIDPQILNRIFDPYFTTKIRGSGLGLTVVKRFAKDHGGEIKVESQPGNGTTFHLEIPILCD